MRQEKGNTVIQLLRGEVACIRGHVIPAVQNSNDHCSACQLVRASRRTHLLEEAITDTPFGSNIARVLSIITELVAQATYEHL